ncbi:MAG: YihY/virulence factor BrkB family protein [Tepidisphaeraceae bacterium]
MATLAQVPHVIRTVGAWGFLKRIWAEVSEDNLLTWASALAYSWLFAVFPFFLFLLTLIPFIPEGMKGDLEHQLAVWVYHLPKEAADTVWINIAPRIKELLDTKVTGLPIIGALVTLWAASGGVAATMGALDRCYDVQRSRPIYKQRPLAIGLTVVLVVLILLVLVLLPIGTIVTNFLVEYFAKQGLDESYMPILTLWQILRYALAMTLMVMTLATLYHFGPNVKQRWVTVTPGSIFVIVVWLALGAAFRFYIDRFGKYNQTYGTVGGVVILLFFFYLDALVLLIGAEINAEVDAVVAGAPLGVIEAVEEHKLAPGEQPQSSPQTPGDALAKPPEEPRPSG